MCITVAAKEKNKEVNVKLNNLKISHYIIVSGKKTYADLLD